MCSRRTNFFLFLFIFFSFNSFSQRQKDSIAYFEERIRSVNNMSIDSAIYYFERLNKIFPDKKRVKLLRKKARYLSEYGGRESTISTYKEAVRLAKSIKDKQLEGILYHDFGFYYYNSLNDNSKAYKYFLLAQDLYVELDDQIQLNIIKTNIATFFSDNHRFKEAEKIFDETLAYYENKKDTVNIVFVKINIGGLESSRKNYATSDKIFKELLNYKYLSKSDRSLVYYNLAINALEQNKYEKAETNINQSIKISKTIGDELQLIDLYFLKAEIAKQTKKFKKASNFLTKSLLLAKKNKDYYFQQELLEKLISLSVINKKYLLIDSLFQELSIINDTISNKEKRNTFNEIYLSNLLDKKEKELGLQHKLLKKKKESIKLYITIIVLSFLFLLVLSAYILSHKRNNSKRLELLKNKIKIKEIENKAKRKYEELETKRIQKDLKAKKRELLIDYSLKAKRIENKKKVLKKMEEISNKSIISKEDILNLIDYAKSKHKELIVDAELKSDIALINKDFYGALLKDFPSLTKTELKVLSLITTGLETKEIANIQNVSVDAIRKTRYRIRKKIGLKSDESLENFLLKHQ